MCYNLGNLFAQTLPTGSPALEESLRRKQFLGEIDSTISFNLRPLQPNFLFGIDPSYDYAPFETGYHWGEINRDSPDKVITWMPVRNTLALNTGRPYGYGNGPMIPNVGFQYMLTGGIAAKYKFFNIQLMPELVWAQNRPYQGFPDNLGNSINSARYVSWNHGDNPERFGTKSYSKLGLGQSKITLNYGSFEMGASTQNIWWGPGQFNALIFSNNARGFPHLTLNTTRPAKTFLGSFEGQLIMGKLQPSGFEGSQNPLLNDQYFDELSEDWRYLNGISISYQPKWVPGLFLGLNRTFQQYSEDKTNSFGDWFPVFEVLTKSGLIDGGNTVNYDGKRQDQQISIFGRYLVPKAQAEFYFEYGRRDHALNWREFMLNPEHARAYLMGFNKIFKLPVSQKMVQVRAEMTQQQESVNRYIRYGLRGGTSWHAHYQVRGFTNYGESMGVGAGQAGSNIQTLELSLIDKLNKYGIVLERLANHQDFYYRGLGQQSERKPWVDLSLGLLFDYQWDRFLLSSRLQFINGLNYQWQLEPESTPEFPVGKDKFSVFAQIHLIYLLPTIDHQKIPFF
ncbi:capsule assembly Wzi family protein [Echinicola jeungdonensis]|uniref:Capsule assembly Wzi family protein n=1 Tax=Echinicola jeungdonensis TaxID=709343 RepID=A0ABV5J2P9_9BACT|nr:capsule assembly Wzi family protein [Echinicola jeungdonensis]MDN3668109.1 capsule assembly Wzi family protein [Echinicola jeungdonensis]